MRSARSCFEPTLYKKDLLRFWPLWVSYTVLWLFLLPLELFSRAQWASMSSLLNYALRLPVSQTCSYGPAFALVYGTLCALALWSYLYNARSANQLHALPLRREGHFLTRTAVGVTLFLLPHLIILLITVLVELSCGLGTAAVGVLVQAMGYQSLMCLFFFALGTFCALLTGHIVAMPAFVAIANLLVYGAATLVDTLSKLFLFGYNGSIVGSSVVQFFTPVVHIYQTLDYNLANTSVPVPGETDTVCQGYAFVDTGCLWAYAGVGLVLLALALLLLRRRHLETAGDVVAVPILRPVFQLGTALCGGVAGGLLTYYVFTATGSILLLVCFTLIWTVVASYAAKMLLEKSFRVLRAGWKNCAAALVVVLCLLGALQTDLLGIETKVPDADQIASAEFYTGSTYPEDSGRWSSGMAVADSETIAKVLAVHQTIADNIDYIQRLAGNSSYWSSSYETELVGTVGDVMTSSYFSVTYYLKDGSTFRRYYGTLWLDPDRLEDPTSLEAVMTELVNDPQRVRDCYDLDALERAESFASAWLNVSSSSADADKMTMEDFLKMGFSEDEVTSGWAYEMVSQWDDQYYTCELPLYGEETAALLRDAILADFEAGNLGVRYLFWDDPQLEEESLGITLSLGWYLYVLDVPASKWAEVLSYLGDSVNVDLEEIEGYIPVDESIRPYLNSADSPLLDFYNSEYHSVYVELTRSAVNTLAVLEQLGVMDGYEVIAEPEVQPELGGSRFLYVNEETGEEFYLCLDVDGSFRGYLGDELYSWGSWYLEDGMLSLTDDYTLGYAYNQFCYDDGALIWDASVSEGFFFLQWIEEGAFFSPVTEEPVLE